MQCLSEGMHFRHTMPGMLQVMLYLCICVDGATLQRGGHIQRSSSEHSTVQTQPVSRRIWQSCVSTPGHNTLMLVCHMGTGVWGREYVEALKPALAHIYHHMKFSQAGQLIKRHTILLRNILANI